MKSCDACGSTKASVSIGGAMLCRTCANDIRTEIDRKRAAGESVNALGIARTIFREQHSVGGYLLRDIPQELWDKAKHKAVDESGSLRDLILNALRAYLK